jgi:hypothetical protein
VERHEPTQARIAEAVSMFWASVQAGVEPLWLADFDVVKEAQARGNNNAPPIDLTSDESAGVDARRYMRWIKHLKRVEAQTDMLKARLGHRMEEATKAIIGDLEVAWVASGRPAKMIYPPEPFWQEAKVWRGAFSVKPRKEPKPVKTPKQKVTS